MRQARQLLQAQSIAGLHIQPQSNPVNFTKVNNLPQGFNWLSELEHMDVDVFNKLVDEYIDPLVKWRATAKAVRKRVILGGPLNYHNSFAHPGRKCLTGPTLTGDPYWRRMPAGSTKIEAYMRNKLYTCHPLKAVYPELEVGRVRWRGVDEGVTIHNTKAEMIESLKARGIPYYKSWTKSKLVKALLSV